MFGGPGVELETEARLVTKWRIAEDWGKGGGPINWRQQIPSGVVIDTVLIVSL